MEGTNQIKIKLDKIAHYINEIGKVRVFLLLNQSIVCAASQFCDYTASCQSFFKFGPGWFGGRFIGMEAIQG